MSESRADSDVVIMMSESRAQADVVMSRSDVVMAHADVVMSRADAGAGVCPSLNLALTCHGGRGRRWPGWVAATSCGLNIA
eukprot:889110-Rhodomonas_salina.2